ncbi:MAG TPA: serine/threonine-protein kinase [Polyangiaceae bacterium]
MSDADAPFASGDPLIGRVVHDRYRITRAIGKGGMGVVYEAEHLHTGRTVALKVLSAHAALSPSSLKRFQQEARAAASIGNSHIVDVLDMGQLDAGSLFMVLEHLNGMDLGFAVALANRFPLARAVDVVAQLCDALSAVHAAGIVHRDLKPENVFLIRRDGQPDFVKVLDFGICKVSTADGGRLTESGDTLGTPQFMAPEQIEGRRDIDHRTDIYAIGLILYFLLAGHTPFDGATLPKLLLRICNDPIPSVRTGQPDLPSELDAILQRALHKNPEHRFDSCAELKAALLSLGKTGESYTTLMSVDAARYSAVEPPVSEGPLVVPVERLGWSSRAALGVGFVILLVGGVVAFAGSQHSEKEAAPASSELAESPLVEAASSPAVVLPPPPPVASVAPSAAPVASTPRRPARPAASEQPPAASAVAPPASAAISPVTAGAPASSGVSSGSGQPSPAASASQNPQQLLLQHGLKRDL